MANAFLLPPLTIVDNWASGTYVSGNPAYLRNDYAGMTSTHLCDLGNAAFFGSDLGSDQTFDAIMAFGLADLPTSATFVIDGSTNAAPDTFVRIAEGPAYAGGTPRSDGRGVLLALLPAPVTYRRVSLAVIAATAGQRATLARIVIGRRFQPSIGFEYGAQFGVRDLGSLDVNARGVLLRHRGKKLRTVSLNFPSLTKQEAEGSAQKLLEQIGNTECIALCTDPTPDGERQSRCYFGPLVGDLSRTWVSARGHEVRVNLLGLL